MKTTIDGEGRIALGAEIQLQLGVHPGDDVVLESRGDECVIRPSRATVGLVIEGNVLVHRTAATNSTEAGLASLRDERLEQLTQGLPR